MNETMPQCPYCESWLYYNSETDLICEHCNSLFEYEMNEDGIKLIHTQ